MDNLPHNVRADRNDNHIENSVLGFERYEGHGQETGRPHEVRSAWRRVLLLPTVSTVVQGAYTG